MGIGSFALVGGLWLGAHGIIDGFNGHSDDAVPETATVMILEATAAVAFAVSRGAKTTPDELSQSLDNRGEV